MNRRTKRVVLSALATVVATASLMIGTTTQASAMEPVECYDRTDLLTVVWHVDHSSGWSQYITCFANAGEYDFDRYGTEWLDQVQTGNNRFQWYGDGRWQPNSPIEKWTTFRFNDGRSAKLDKGRIL